MAEVKFGESVGMDLFVFPHFGEDRFVKYEPWMRGPAKVIEAQAARIAELEADKRRLEWMERPDTGVMPYAPSDTEPLWEAFSDGCDVTCAAKTVREAIDAAMSAEDEGEG